MTRINHIINNLFVFFKNHYSQSLNVIVVIFLLLFPYFLFEGKISLGGDDTRLFYVYPKEYLINTQFFSWINLSSVGWNFSYQSFIPFVFIWTILAEIIKSKIVLGYFSFSLPFIFGLVYFQLFVKELIIIDSYKYKSEAILGSLFYIFSPILINNHFVNPLIPIWLIGLIPAVCYYFLRFVKSGRISNIFKAAILVTVFSFGAHNSPWAMGFILPISISLIISSCLFKKQNIYLFIKRFILFFSIILLSQSFWLFVFLMNLIVPSSSNFTAKVLSESMAEDFSRSVLATSRGSIIYPLLNLYPRQIAFDFGWNLKNIYESFYDKTYFINLLYPVIVFLGIFNFKKYTNIWEKKIFIIILIAFSLSIYFFTVNIGPLLNLYILFGHIPGFVMFRIPVDKFAMGYVLIYSLLITCSLVIFRRKYKSKNKLVLVVYFLFLVTIVVNILPIKKIIISPLYAASENIYKNITIPDEYLDFMTDIKETVPSTNNILSIPYGIALYTIIKDVDSDNVYAGVSPVVIFSGVNDISGNLSFNFSPQAKIVENSIINRDYNTLNNVLFIDNINYVLLTKNIPEEIKKSVLYLPDAISAQDSKFISNITNEKIISSSEGNYELYSTKRQNFIITSHNTTYKKLNRVKYKIRIENIKQDQEILFNDSFHEQWELYPSHLTNNFTCNSPRRLDNLKTVECAPEIIFFELGDLNYLWSKDLFRSSHVVNNNFSNKWTIDFDWIINNLSKDYYEINEDGSIDLELVLYYKSQVYFYIGITITIIVFLILIAIILSKRK